MCVFFKYKILLCNSSDLEITMLESGLELMKS